MTEAEWLACEDPGPMITALGDGDSRKDRLLASACCRWLWHLLTDGRSRRAVEAAEAYADGLGSELDLLRAEAEAMEAAKGLVDRSPAEWYMALTVVRTSGHPLSVGDVMSHPAEDWDCPPRTEAERAAQLGLLRDVYANPFRPVTLDPIHLTPTVASLAEAVYQERELPSGHLDPVRLAVLSDGLEEAGCTDADLLSHLRSPGPHVRGCWALDLILGKS